MTLTKMKDLRDLSVISEKKTAQVWLLSSAAASSLFFFFDHHFCPHVTDHIKAIQNFTFCFNSKLTCSFSLCTLCLSITLLGVFPVLSLTSLLRCPRNTHSGSSKKSEVYGCLLLTYHLFESPFTAYEK